MNNPASIAELGLTDDEIEAIALKHVAPGAKTLREIVPGLAPYQQSWQFQRIKAFLIDALAARRAPADNSWQPINTAPQGVRVLLGPRHAPVVGTVKHYEDPDSDVPAIVCSVVHYNGSVFVVDYRASEWAPLPSAEQLVRYCPGCGSVGPVEGKYRDCCPDGGEARMIPAPLAEKCRDTFKIAVKGLLADAAANEAGPNHVPSATEEHTLRAMARNYTDRHLWDQLDSKTIIAAADEIRALRGALTVRAQPAEHGGAHG